MWAEELSTNGLIVTGLVLSALGLLLSASVAFLLSLIVGLDAGFNAFLGYFAGSLICAWVLNPLFCLLAKKVKGY